jgi:AraC-like DNA-binding protein
MVLTSTRFDLEARQWESSHRYSIVFPYRTLGLPDKLVDSLLSARLQIDEALSCTVSSFLTRVVRQSVRGDAAMALFSTPIVDMVRGVISAAAGDAVRAREPLADTLFPRIMEYVRLHLFDHGLSAARIAHAHDISVRYLYMILARESLSLGDWIREQRAHRAARLLTDPDHDLSIADIAYRTGYADQAHFSRSFRRWYDTSPREWRRMHR